MPGEFGGVDAFGMRRSSSTAQPLSTALVPTEPATLAQTQPSSPAGGNQSRFGGSNAFGRTSAFGLSQTTTSQPQSQSTFGGTDAFGLKRSAPPQGGPSQSLFPSLSQPQSQLQPQPQSQSLFPSLSQPQSQSLFQSQPQPQSQYSFQAQAQAQPQTQSLFSSQSQPQTQSLFSSQPQPQAQSLFSSQSQPQTQPLFSSQSQPQTQSLFQPQTQSLFQSKSQPLFQSGFRSQLGAQPLASLQQQQQQQQLQPQPPTVLTTTPIYMKQRYQDVPDAARGLIDQIEGEITKKMQIMQDLRSCHIDREVVKGSQALRHLQNEHQSVSALLEEDVVLVKELRDRVEKDYSDMIIAARIVDGHKDPHNQGSWLKTHVKFPFEFFSREAELFRECIQRSRATLEQIAHHVSVIDSREQYTPQAVSEIIHTQHASLVALAAQVGEMHAEIQRLKKQYRELWQERTNALRDPFASSAITAT